MFLLKIITEKLFYYYILNLYRKFKQNNVNLEILINKKCINILHNIYLIHLIKTFLYSQKC